MEEEKLLEAQREEATEARVYRALAGALSGPAREVLERIAQDEERHYAILREKTGRDVPPSSLKLFAYLLLAKLFGPSFVLHLMEFLEKRAQEVYRELGLHDILEDERKHEQELLKLLEGEDYLWAVILGLNDAIVELSASLVGLAFSLGNNLLTAFAGFVVGFSASLSMALSAFFSARESGQNPYKAALYTGAAYITTTALLILPYLLTPSPVEASLMMVAVIVVVLSLYAFYKTVVKGTSFWRELALHLSLALLVALFSFTVGQLLKGYLGIEV